jgi:hypothetical protein
MNERIVEFETAKLAKELNFNEICSVGYDDDDRSKINMVNINFEDMVTSAPTQCQLHDWLMKNFDFYVEVRRMDTLMDLYSFQILSAGNGIRPIHSFSESRLNVFEKGLRRALKIIKNGE